MYGRGQKVCGEEVAERLPCQDSLVKAVVRGGGDEDANCPYLRVGGDAEGPSKQVLQAFCAGRLLE